MIAARLVVRWPTRNASNARIAFSPRSLSVHGSPLRAARARARRSRSIRRRGRHGRQQGLGVLGSARSSPPRRAWPRPSGPEARAAWRPRAGRPPPGRAPARRRTGGEDRHGRATSLRSRSHRPGCSLPAVALLPAQPDPSPQGDHRPGELRLGDVAPQFGHLPAIASRRDEHIGQRQTAPPRSPVDAAFQAVVAIARSSRSAAAGSSPVVTSMAASASETGGLAEVGISFLAPDASHELPCRLDVADPGDHESGLRRAHELELENADGLGDR